MATVVDSPHEVEGRVVLHNISWKTYEQIMVAIGDCSAPRLTYDEGELEIMSPSPEHEEINRAIDKLVSFVAFELEVEARDLGSTTFKLELLKRGFEPDSCFYVQNEPLIRDKDRLDLAVDPPPDLVIEIDITSSSTRKRAIFARFGVPEVWRYDGRQVEIFKLVGSDYIKLETSVVLPFFTAEVLTRFVAESRTLSRLEWMKSVRDWARLQRESRSE
jgi:Uma2 family endonuclease